MSTDQAPADEQTTDAPAQETDWKAQARRWEDRAKANRAEADANKAAAERLAQIEDEAKTEAQRLTDRLSQSEQRATAAERDLERMRVIAKHAVPEEYQDLIQGADTAALEASAQKVAGLIKTHAASSASYVIPTEGTAPAMPLNGDGIERSLRNVLGIQ